MFVYFSRAKRKARNNAQDIVGEGSVTVTVPQAEDGFGTASVQDNVHLPFIQDVCIDDLNYDLPLLGTKVGNLAQL